MSDSNGFVKNLAGRIVQPVDSRGTHHFPALVIGAITFDLDATVGVFY